MDGVILPSREDAYRALCETSPDGMLVLNVDGTIRLANGRACRMLRGVDEPLAGAYFLDFIAPEDRNRAAERVRSIAQNAGSVKNVEYDVVDETGRRFPAEVSMSAVPDSQGTSRMLTAVVRDISLRRAAETALRESESGFRLLFARSPVPMWVADATSLEFLQVNDAAIQLYGFSRFDFATMRLPDLMAPGSTMSRGEDGRPYEARHRRKDGAVIDVELVSHVMYLSGQPVILMTAQDVTARKLASEQLRHRALHDPLTDLPNRALLEDRLERAIASANRARSDLALLIVDLDGFKGINDTYGHLMGDRVLKETAARLSGALRESDTVARFGGDEFVVLLPHSGHRGAEVVAQTILRALDAPLVLDNAVASVRASVGIAHFPEDGRTATELVAAADAAMYRAKHSAGGNVYVLAGGEHARR